MCDYKKMYFALFNKITDITQELEKIQIEMEEIYVNNNLECISKGELTADNK